MKLAVPRTSPGIVLTIFAMMVVYIVITYSPWLWSSPWSIIQDDGRHFVAWLRQLSDPALFAGDPIADHFLALTPQIYKLLFYPAAWTGIDIVAWHLLVVVPLSIVLFLWSAERFLSRFLDNILERTIVLLILMALCSEIVTVGLPRSFSFTIVFAVLAGFAGNNRIMTVVALALGANMYPIAAIVSGFAIGIAALLGWIVNRKVDIRQLVTLIAGAIAGAAGLLLFLKSTGQAGPTFTAEAARTLPIFQDGRARFFHSSLYRLILCDRGRGSGLPICVGGPGLMPVFITLAILAAGWMVVRRQTTNRTRFATIFVGLLVSGLLFFVISYMLLFKAHLPERVKLTSLTIEFYLAIAVLAAALLKALATRFKLPFEAFVAGCYVFFLGVSVYVALDSPRLVKDRNTALSTFIRTLPKDTVVAGWNRYISNVPAFSGRSAYAAMELAIPYKIRHYDLISERAATMVQLYNGPLSPEWKALLENSGIDYFVVRNNEDRDIKHWARSFTIVNDIRDETVFDANPQLVARCTVFEDRGAKLIDAACMAKDIPG